MRWVGGLLLVVGGTYAAIGGHLVPSIDAVTQLAHVTRIATAPPLADGSLPSGASRAGASQGRGDGAATAGNVWAAYQNAPVVAGSSAETPRIFSPDQPLFSAPRANPSVALPQRSPLRTETGVVNGVTVNADRGAVLAQAPAGAPAVDAVQARPSAPRHNGSQGSTRVGDGGGKVALIRDLQRELKRVGCYGGDVDGSWGASSRQAMTDFTTRVNASLPVDQPDFILLTLVQGHAGQACNVSCRAGETASSDGRCLPQMHVAQSPDRRMPSPNARATYGVAGDETATRDSNGGVARTAVPAPTPAKRIAKVTGGSAPFPAAGSGSSDTTWVTTTRRDAGATRMAAGRPDAGQAQGDIIPPLPTRSRATKVARSAEPPAPSVEGSAVVLANRGVAPFAGRMSIGATVDTGAAPPPAIDAAPEAAAELRRKAAAEARAAAAEARAAAEEEREDRRRARRAEARRRVAEAEARRPRPQPSYQRSYRRSSSFKNPQVVRDFFFSPTRN